MDKSPGKTPDQRRVPEYNMEQETTSDIIPTNNNKENNMDISLNTKRPHQTRPRCQVANESSLYQIPMSQETIKVRRRRTKTTSRKDRTFNFIMYLVYLCSFVYFAFNLISINSQGLCFHDRFFKSLGEIQATVP